VFNFNILDRSICFFNFHYLPMKKVFAYIFICCILVTGNAQFVNEVKTAASFSLSNAVIYVDDADDALVKKAAELLQQDIEMVIGKKLQLINKLPSSSSFAIIIGSLQRSSGISQLIKQKKINVKNISNKWEAYQLQSLSNTLVIAGSDRRGTPGIRTWIKRHLSWFIGC